MNERKLDILVLAGGESTERDVSLTSARAVVRTLVQGGHRVTIMDGLDGRRLHLKDDGFTDDDGYGYLQVRDGTTLSVNVRLPDPLVYGAGPYPTLLQYDGPPPGNVSADDAAWCRHQLAAAGWHAA